MKKLLTLLLTSVMLTGSLTACSIHISFGDDDEKGTVSEKRRGDDDDDDEDTSRKKKDDSEDEEKPAEETTQSSSATTTTAASVSTVTTTVKETNVIRRPTTFLLQNGLFLVNEKIFGMSLSEVSNFLNADLGEPEDFPWWEVHQTLYYYEMDGFTVLLFFNDRDELDVIQLDQHMDFDMSIVYSAEEYYGVSPEVYYYEYSDWYDFEIFDGTCMFSIYEEIYSTTDELWFRQRYTSLPYYTE